MTFERFYSIIQPHKAASFNTVKRAKIIIVSLFIIFHLYNLPYLFISTVDGLQCVPWGKISNVIGQIYYYLQIFLAYIFPFVALLAMNCVIIHTLRTRSFGTLKSEGNVQASVQSQKDGQVSKMKNSEKQIYITLLSVTFGFLLLTTPSYVLQLYTVFVGTGNTQEDYAQFYLFYQLGEKTYHTNYAVNFFLYVISGSKFRADLMKLFVRQKEISNEVVLA